MNEPIQQCTAKNILRLPKSAPHTRPTNLARVSALACALAIGLASCTDTPAAKLTVTSSAATNSASAPADGQTAAGKLVDGFPAKLIPVVPQSQILTSSRASNKTQPALTNFSFNAKVANTIAAVQSHFEATLLASGFALLPPSTTPTVSTYTYAKSGTAEIISITATQTANSASVEYTVLATVSAAGA